MILGLAALAVAGPFAAAGEGSSAKAGDLSFETLDGWREHDPRPALAALRRQCDADRDRPGLAPWLPRLCARLPADADAAAARAFFERWFRPEPLRRDGTGFLTAYFEPELAASPVPTDRFAVPLRAPPPGLERLDPAAYPPGLPPGLSHARRRPDGRLVPLPDRAAIEAGALDGAARPIAYLADPVDAFFVHVQGSARLAMPDGAVRRVGYAGKSGHPYTAIGRVLVEEGRLAAEAVTADAIRAVLAADPEAARAVMDRNRSYVFFRDKPGGDPSLGPVAAGGVQLTPRASVAVDRSHVAYGTPVYLWGDLPVADADVEAPFATLAIAQDTGSAIVGPARADLFLGSGEAAGRAAGRVKHRVGMVRLVFRDAADGADAPGGRP